MEMIHIEDLAKLTGYNPVSIRNLAMRGVIPKIENARVPLVESLGGICRDLRRQLDEREPQFESYEQLQSVTGIPVELAQHAKAQGCDAFANGQRIRLYPLIKWIVQFFLAQSGSPKKLNLIEERARLYKEQADKLALKNAITRSELRPWADVIKFISRVLEPMRSRLISLESVAAKVNPQDPEAARAVLRQWTDDTLAILRSAVAEDKDLGNLLR
jgi:hypothetical protein